MWLRVLTAALVGLTLSAQETPNGKEEALGAQMAANMQKWTTPLDNPDVAGYVAHTGGKFAADRKCTFAVVTDELGGRSHEPVAFPGCHVFVSTSLLLAAGDEGEFAGMLAHALAHRASRGQTVNPDGIPLVFLGGWNGDQDLTVSGPFRKLLRAGELEADQKAVRSMADAGYDPPALSAYLSRTEPKDVERIAALDRAISGLPVRTYPAAGEEFERIRNLVRDLSDERPTSRRHDPPTLLRPDERN
jgi:predicted Zn-dependent protease